MKAVIFEDDGKNITSLGEIYSPSITDCMFNVVYFKKEEIAVFENAEDFREAIAQYGGYEQRDFLSEF